MIQKTLLIIDDDRDFNTLVEIFLYPNWHILTASNGKKGIDLAKSQQPDLVLLDVEMPQLNGLAIYKLLKLDSTTSSIPIIFLTAMVRMEKIIRAKILDNIIVDDITDRIEIISKPFHMTALEQKIIEACDRISANTN